MPEASVDVATIRDRFNMEWCIENDAEQDTYWWWARSIRVDPNEVIADDDAGGLWSVTFTTDGEDSVEFSAPVRVRETFVPVQAADGAAANAVVSRRRQQTLAANLDRPVKPDRGNPAATVPPEPQEGEMPEITPEQLQRLRALPEDATQDQIAAAIAGSEPPEPVAEVEETETETEATPETELVPAAAAVTNDGVRAALSLPSTATDEQVRERIAELEAGSRAGASVQAEQIKAGRDKLVDDAVKDGRIPPSARAAWRDALDKQPEAESSALSSLAPNRIPVAERGSAASEETSDTTTTGWFPQLASKEA